MIDVRELFELGSKYLPEDVNADLGLASTTSAWFARLRSLIDQEREKNEHLKDEADGEFIRAEVKNHRREQAQAEVARPQATVETLSQQICEYHDTNPLNETVVELEKRRDALEAENRVVREIVEDALDFLWSANRQAYEGLLPRCTWMMGEEHRQTPNAETVLQALGIRIEVVKAQPFVYETRVNGHRVGTYSFESSAVADTKVLSETLARSVRQATDPLLARVAALLREYEDYMTIADHCTKVYDHFSGGRISKPFTLPSEVIAVAQEVQDEDFETWHREQLEPITEQMAELERENRRLTLQLAGTETGLKVVEKRLRHFAQEWNGASKTLYKVCAGNELTGWIEATFKEKTC